MSTSKQSLVALNATNFFLAEIAAVVTPFLAVYLKGLGWSYSEVGVAAAMAGLGILFFQAPAGYICDLVKAHRGLLAGMSLLTGASIVLLPLTKTPWMIKSLMFTAGASSAFYMPLLATLAMALVGPKRFSAITGMNQAWNHAGKIVVALFALAIVQLIGTEAIFYTTAFSSVIAALALSMIKSGDLNPTKKQADSETKPANPLKNPQVLILLGCVFCFHAANAPILPMVGLYIKKLGGNDNLAGVAILISQGVMIPVALLAGKYGDTMGRKNLFLIGFFALPVRIILTALTSNQTALIAIQALDGIGSGIYGVVIALIAHDLTKGKGGFNTLMGLAQTMLAMGSFIGPLAQGFGTENLGFTTTFFILAGLASLGATMFLTIFKETKSEATA